jgi:hypothetical protein
MSDNQEIKSILKSEYAKKLNVSIGTLSKYLNDIFFEELKKLSYQKYQRILTPKQIKFLNEKLCNFD